MNVLGGSWKPTMGDNPVLVIVAGIAIMTNTGLLLAINRGWIAWTLEDVALLMGGMNTLMGMLSAVLARATAVPASKVMEVEAVRVTDPGPPATIVATLDKNEDPINRKA